MSATDNVVAIAPYRELFALKGLVREAAALGARFRLSGADVEIDGLNDLPDPLQDALLPHAASGMLWSYFDGDTLDDPALDLAEHLGVEMVLVETRTGCREAIRTLLANIKEHGDIIGLDIETSPYAKHDRRPWAKLTKDGSLAAKQPQTKDGAGLDPYRAAICTLQLYAGGTRCFVLRGEALAMVLRSNWLWRQSVCIHNAPFELKFLQHHVRYRLPPGRARRFAYECTMQAAGLVRGVGHGGEKRRLDTVAKAALGVDVPKDLQTSHWAAERLSPGQVCYAGCDAVLARRIWTVSETRLRQLKRWNAYELQRAAIRGVADMELRGAGFDREAHHQQSTTWARELAKARQEYFELTGRPPPTTPNEVRGWLGTVLTSQELARWEPTATGLPTIKAKALRTLGHIPSARPVLRILDREKLISGFGPKLAAWVNPVTGRLHPHSNIAATKSGRFTSTNPNFQQLPRDSRAAGFRACIAAAPGYVLIGADYSQIELRALAFLSKNRALTRVYAEGRDLHTETAARIARVPIEDVTAHQRQDAKPVNFGSIFGMRGPGLAAYAFDAYGVEMTVREAEQALGAFFAAYPGLKESLDDHYEICQRRGYVAIGAGRVVMVAWEPGRKLTYQQCCNLPVQGIAADAMLRAIALTYDRLRRSRIRGGLIATVHDELLLEVHEDDADKARVLLEDAMVEAFTLTFAGAPTNGVATATIGRNWVEVKNPPKVSEDTRDAAIA